MKHLSYLLLNKEFIIKILQKNSFSSIFLLYMFKGCEPKLVFVIICKFHTFDEV